MLLPRGQGRVAPPVLLVTLTLFPLLRNCICETVIPPILSEHPPELLIYVLHQKVSLPCQAEGSPSPSYYWTKDGDRLDTEGGRYDMREGSLYIPEADQDHQGIYYCWAYNQAGTDRSPPSNLTLAFLKSFLDTADQRQVALGSSVLLPCEPPESVPPPNITWYTRHAQQRQTEVVMSDNIIVDLDNNLHILNFGSTDAGDYFCEAKNIISRSLVQGPFITLSAADTQDATPGEVELRWQTASPITALVGSTLKMQCIFAGNPPPIINWQKTGADMHLGRWQESQGGSTIAINDVNMADSGVYECAAFNELSLQPAYGKIDVIVQAPPKIVSTPYNMNVTAGEHIRLVCGAAGLPPPVISYSINWNRLVNEVDSKENNIYVTDQSEGEFVRRKLHMRRAWPRDTMVVGCTASNKHGEIYTSSYINVIGSTHDVVGSSGDKISRSFHYMYTVLCCLAMYGVHAV